MTADHSHGMNVTEAERTGHAVAHTHPDWKTYRWVALFLTVLTAMEVWVYYIPSFVVTRLFVPTLLVLSIIKFATVVLFYMHLKYDARLFRALFTGPLIIAVTVVVSLLFLFGHLAVHT